MRAINSPIQHIEMKSSEPSINQELKNRIAALPPEKRVLFEQILRQQTNSGKFSPQKTIPRRQENTELPPFFSTGKIVVSRSN